MIKFYQPDNTMMRKDYLIKFPNPLQFIFNINLTIQNIDLDK